MFHSLFSTFVLLRRESPMLFVHPNHSILRKGNNPIRVGFPVLIACILLLFPLLAKFMGIIGLLLLLLIPFLVRGMDFLFKKPREGLLLLFGLSFVLLGISRYIPLPVGLAVDGFLILLWLALFFRHMGKPAFLQPANKDIVWLVLLWYGFIFFQIFNPEAVSFQAWFYAMRGVGLYCVLIIPLAMLLLTSKDVSRFLTIWGVMATVGALNGLRQLFIGLDPFEWRWLNEGGEVTHVLRDRLRIFSHYTDAGQFGASQAYAFLVFSLLFLNEKKQRRKLFYLIVALASGIGMLISGTRGALVVPAAGILCFLILSRNIRLFALVLVLSGSSFYLLKYTFVGQSNYFVRRMRTALDPNNPSLMIRLENQKKLKTYLASRPIGGGLGTSGNWGQRFSPNTFLAQIPTDSWFVMIWAENGIIGLSLHLVILLYILVKGSYITLYRIRSPQQQHIRIALICGYFGVIIASYGNGVLGQMPTGLTVYLSWVFIFLPQRATQENLAETKQLNK